MKQNSDYITLDPMYLFWRPPGVLMGALTVCLLCLLERAAAAERQIHSGEPWIRLVFRALASEMELGCFQNRYGAAELSNKQLHIKQDRDTLWQEAAARGGVVLLRIQF